MKNNTSAVGSPCRSARCVLSTISLLALGAVASQAGATPPSATLWYAADREAVQTTVIEGTPLANGDFAFAGTILGPNGNWQITYNLVVDTTNSPLTSLAGTIALKNNTDATHSYHAGFDVPICPMITDGSLLGGTSKVTLIASGPGSLTCASGNGLVQAAVDGDAAASLFFCPFALTATGSGTLSSTTQFGLPGPSFVGPATVETIGQRLSFQLTSGDTASFLTTLFFKDANGFRVPFCPGDLDLNGSIDGGDIAELFATWGFTSSCAASLPGDLNGDGVVDSNDLILLLNEWGVCGNGI